MPPDLAFVTAALGQSGTSGPGFPADVTRDGVVTVADISAVQARFGPLADPSRIVGYWIEWGIYGRNYQPIHTPFEKVTHLNYAFAKINPDFTIAPFDAYAAIDKYYPGDTWNQPYPWGLQPVEQRPQGAASASEDLDLGRRVDAVGPFQRRRADASKPRDVRRVLRRVPAHLQLRRYRPRLGIPRRRRTRDEHGAVP
jgi:hypothetical protein